MEQKYFNNPYDDYKGENIEINEKTVKNLIKNYVDNIITHTKQSHADDRGDLYVGDSGRTKVHLRFRFLDKKKIEFCYSISGIAYMFLQLCQSNQLVKETNAKENAIFYINRAKQNGCRSSKPRDYQVAFLCGYAGIYAVSAAISNLNSDQNALRNDLAEFSKGFEACKPIAFNKTGCDEVLVGRAGFLSGVYWLNDIIRPKPFTNDDILNICESIIVSGRQYSKAKRSPFPLMYQYHSTEYLGAAHGLCGILHMLLDSPWFDKSNQTQPPKDYLADIKATIDGFVGMNI